MRSPGPIHGWRHAVATGVLLCVMSGMAFAAESLAAAPPAAAPPTTAAHSEVREPTGPKDVPEMLPGRWSASLCIAENNGHAWIRLENLETGEVRTIGRYHLLVGGWFDREHFRWYYPPTFRTGLYMDREQKSEFLETAQASVLLTETVEDPQLLIGGRATGHGFVRNNCVTYTRDIWYVLTGEHFDLPPIHTPRALRKAVETAHPEIVSDKPGDERGLLRTVTGRRTKPR